MSTIETVPNVGDLWELRNTFYSDAAETTPADPTGITLTIRNPAGVEVVKALVDITRDSVGVYHYDWTPTAGGDYEIRWVGTGAVTVAETETISVSGWPIGSLIGTNYLTVAQLKATLEMTGTSFADADVAIAIGAASRAVDTITDRRFWLDDDANQVRYYTPTSSRLLQIDDAVAVTSVAIDRSDTGSYSEAWVSGTDFVLEPFNAAAARPARPYTTLRVRNLRGLGFQRCYEQSVKVTGQFGWPAVPDDVTAATSIIAAKLLRRTREAPFGIVTAGIDSGVAMRIASADPDAYMLLSGYVRMIVV